VIDRLGHEAPLETPAAFWSSGGSRMLAWHAEPRTTGLYYSPHEKDTRNIVEPISSWGSWGLDSIPLN